MTSNVVAKRSHEGEALVFSRGSGGMLPLKILKIEMLRYAFFSPFGSLNKATVIIFFVSRRIKTPKAMRLGEKKIIWAKKKKRLSGSPQARAVLETVCSRH